MVWYHGFPFGGEILDMNKIPKVRDLVRVRKEAFGALVFTNRTPILALNEDSLLIWSKIDATRTVDDIVALLQKSEGTEAVNASVVEDFFKACEDLDLITLE